MNIQDLGPAYGATKTRTRVGRGIGSGLGKLLERDIKVKKLELVEASEEALKVDKHHFIEEFQKRI